MDAAQYVGKIKNSTAHRPVRDLLSGLAFADAALGNCLLECMLDLSFPEHYKACWIAELLLEKDLDRLLPHLDVFCKALPHYQHEGALRSVSKICLFASKRHARTGVFLTPHQAQTIAESCMDWLISEAKVATKAYAMRALLELGRTQKWIYPNLKEILQQDFSAHSAGYKAAAKDVLRQLS